MFGSDKRLIIMSSYASNRNLIEHRLFSFKINLEDAKAEYILNEKIHLSQLDDLDKEVGNDK